MYKATLANADQVSETAAYPFMAAYHSWLTKPIGMSEEYASLKMAQGLELSLNLLTRRAPNSTTDIQFYDKLCRTLSIKKSQIFELIGEAGVLNLLVTLSELYNQTVRFAGAQNLEPLRNLMRELRFTLIESQLKLDYTELLLPALTIPGFGFFEGVLNIPTPRISAGELVVDADARMKEKLPTYHLDTKELELFAIVCSAYITFRISHTPATTVQSIGLRVDEVIKNSTLWQFRDLSAKIYEILESSRDGYYSGHTLAILNIARHIERNFTGSVYSYTNYEDGVSAVNSLGIAAGVVPSAISTAYEGLDILAILPDKLISAIIQEWKKSPADTSLEKITTVFIRNHKEQTEGEANIKFIVNRAIYDLSPEQEVLLMTLYLWQFAQGQQVNSMNIDEMMEVAETNQWYELALYFTHNAANLAEHIGKTRWIKLMKLITMNFDKTSSVNENGFFNASFNILQRLGIFDPGYHQLTRMTNGEYLSQRQVYMTDLVSDVQMAVNESLDKLLSAKDIEPDKRTALLNKVITVVNDLPQLQSPEVWRRIFAIANEINKQIYAEQHTETRSLFRTIILEKLVNYFDELLDRRNSKLVEKNDMDTLLTLINDGDFLELFGNYHKPFADKVLAEMSLAWHESYDQERIFNKLVDRQRTGAEDQSLIGNVLFLVTLLEATTEQNVAKYGKSEERQPKIYALPSGLGAMYPDLSGFAVHGGILAERLLGSVLMPLNFQNGLQIQHAALNKLTEELRTNIWQRLLIIMIEQKKPLSMDDYAKYVRRRYIEICRELGLEAEARVDLE